MDLGHSVNLAYPLQAVGKIYEIERAIQVVRFLRNLKIELRQNCKTNNQSITHLPDSKVLREI